MPDIRFATLSSPFLIATHDSLLSACKERIGARNIFPKVFAPPDNRFDRARSRDVHPLGEQQMGLHSFSDP
jgi:hypothetical protein